MTKTITRVLTCVSVAALIGGGAWFVSNDIASITPPALVFSAPA